MTSKTFPFQHKLSKKGLVRPYSKNLKPLPETGIICATKKDLDLFKQKLSVKGGGFGFLMSHIYKAENFVLAGPYFGSPYAAAIIETLADSGVKNLIAVGWCGGIDENLEPGDIIIPDSFISEDSTFKSYSNENKEISFDSDFSKEIKEELRSEKIDFKAGKIWTTDSIYRETIEKIEYFIEEKALAVEMENSAILACADFLEINAVCINIVSDLLRDNKWKPCFSSRAFKESRIKLINRIVKYVGSR